MKDHGDTDVSGHSEKARRGRPIWGVCECGHLQRDHRWGHNPDLRGTCPIYPCPCNEYTVARAKPN